MDRTVCHSAQKALIRQQFGYSLSEAPQELLEHLVERFRTLGNTAFRLKQYQGR